MCLLYTLTSHTMYMNNVQRRWLWNFEQFQNKLFCLLVFLMLALVSGWHELDPRNRYRYLLILPLLIIVCYRTWKQKLLKPEHKTFVCITFDNVLLRLNYIKFETININSAEWLLLDNFVFRIQNSKIQMKY